MIRTKAVLRHVIASFGDGTVFGLAANQEPGGLEAQILLFLAESGQRIVALCPSLIDADLLGRYRDAVEKQLPETDRATLWSQGEFLGYGVALDVYLRHLHQLERCKSKILADLHRSPRPPPKRIASKRSSAPDFAGQLAVRGPHGLDADAIWPSDKACLERSLNDEQRYSRGKWLHDRFKYREARRYLLQVSSTHRQAEHSKLLIADTYRREGQFAQEAKVYARLSPDRRRNLLYAISLARSGRPCEALEVLRQAPEDNANTHYYRAICAGEALQFDAAARHAREASRLVPESAEAAYRHLSFCWKAGNYLEIPKALILFWRASAMTAPEPLELIDLPNVRAASDCALVKSADRIVAARGEASCDRRSAGEELLT